MTLRPTPGSTPTPHHQPTSRADHPHDAELPGGDFCGSKNRLGVYRPAVIVASTHNHLGGPVIRLSTPLVATIPTPPLDIPPIPPA